MTASKPSPQAADVNLRALATMNNWPAHVVDQVSRLAADWRDWTIRWRPELPGVRSAGYWASWNRAPGNEVVMVSCPDEERLVAAMRAHQGRW